MSNVAADLQVRHGTEWRQFRLLMHDSLRKLLNSVVLARDADPMQFAIWATVLVATPPSLFGFGQMFRYAMMRNAPPEVVEQALLGSRMFFLLYSMLATALLAALTWEALFPDRTDQEIIGALPVRPRTLAAARLAAALTMAGVFSVAINLPAASFFAFAAATNPQVGFLPLVLVAHLVSALAGCLFTFLALLVLRGVVAFSLGADQADRLATVLQLVAVVALVEVFFYLPTVLPFLVTRMLQGGDATLWLPPTWFVALYAWMAGSARAPYAGLLADQALRGVLMLLAAAAVVTPIYTLPARLMARRALESQSRLRPGVVARTLRAAGRLAPNPVSRAVAQFAIATLGRSRRHLLIVVSYGGVGVAIAAVSVIAARLRVGLIAPEAMSALLAVPLVMMFFLALGVRAAFRMPSDLDANWPFRTSPPSVADAATGTQTALFALVVVPVALTMTVVAALAGWPPLTIATVLAFDIAAGVLLLESVLYGWTVVPFACGHAVDQETLKSRWLWYMVPLNVFAFRNASAQVSALESASSGVIYLAIVAGVAIGIRIARIKRARRETVPFDTPFDERLQVLNLSEATQ